MSTFIAIGAEGDHYVAADAVVRVERLENGTGRLYMRDGTILPLLPAEADAVLNAVRAWRYDNDRPTVPYSYEHR